MAIVMYDDLLGPTMYPASIAHKQGYEIVWGKGLNVLAPLEWHLLALCPDQTLSYHKDVVSMVEFPIHFEEYLRTKACLKLYVFVGPLLHIESSNMFSLASFTYLMNEAMNMPYLDCTNELSSIMCNKPSHAFEAIIRHCTYKACIILS